MTQRQSSFITEVKGGDNEVNSKYKKSSLDITVRKDYAKLQEIVEHFAKKVDQLVEKQRSEYVQAYEFHMSDVQRELYNLREKATAIANDTTREEKIKKLDSDQKWFRNEAMRLDVETNEYRKKMRNIKVLIQSTERERDWLLEKLRSAKEKFRFFKQVRAELVDQYGGGLSLGDSDSSYTLELQHSRVHGGGDTGAWRNQLQNDFLVTRTAPQTLKQTQRNAATLTPLSITKPGSKKDRRHLLSQLVTIRAKLDAIRDLLGQCSNCATTGTWSKQQRRPLSAVLEDCRGLVGSDSPDANETRRQLARELTLYPDVYYALSDLMEQKGLPTYDEVGHIAGPSGNILAVSEREGNNQEDVGCGEEVVADGGSLLMADDVADYFRSQQARRRELELEERGRVVFGK